MNLDKVTQELYQKCCVAPTLKLLGFEYQGNGHYFNVLMQKVFDFSCYSLEECIVKVYQEGIEAGIKEKSEEVKKALRLN